MFAAPSSDQGPQKIETARPGKLSFRTRKTESNYVMTKSTPTLTQSGLLAVLLQRQRYKVFQLAWRRVQLKRARAAYWNALTWAWRALTGPKLRDDSAEPSGRAHGCHTFLRIAPSGTEVHFGANGVVRVYRFYSSRPQIAK